MSEAAATPVRQGVRLRWLDPFGLLSILAMVALALLLFYPLGLVMKQAFFVGDRLDVSVFLAQLTRPAILRVLGDTFFVVGMSCGIALLLGATFAWLNERTDARAGAAADVLPLIPLIVPQIAGVTGWAILLSPQAGLVNGLLRDVLARFGIELETGPFDIFTYAGLIGTMSLYLVPYVYLTISAALQNLNPSLEEAARVGGAGPGRTLWRVTLPAIRPAIITSAILVFTFGVSLFSVPIVIGTGAGIDLLSVRIYRLLYNYPPRTDLAVALSMLLMIVVQLALLFQAVATRSGRHAVIAGKGQSASRVRLGRWRWIAIAAIYAYLALTAVLPIIGLTIVSLQPFWSPAIDIAQLSLANYRFALIENELSVRALLNSVGLGVVGATIGMVLAAVLVLYGHRSASVIRGAIDAITALPATIPHTVVAVAMVVAFSGGWLNLHGTMLVLLLAYMVLFIPQAVRSARSAMAQVGDDLIEAAQISRASQFRTFRRVVLPLMLPGLLAGWVILFVHMSGELTSSALLSGSENPVVGLVLLDMWENGSFPQLAAIAMTMTLLDTVVVFLVLHLFKRPLRS